MGSDQIQQKLSSLSPHYGRNYTLLASNYKQRTAWFFWGIWLNAPWIHTITCTNNGSMRVHDQPMGERERAVTYWNINQHSACWDSSYWVFPISISLYPKQPRSIWYPKSPLDSKQYPGVPLENILVRNNMPCPFITCETCVWTAKCLNCSTVKNNGCTVSSSNLVENTSSGVLAVMFMAICKNCHAMFIWSFFTLGSLAVSSVVHTVLLSKLYLWNNKIKVNIRWTVLSIFKMTALLKSPKHFFLTLSRSLRNLFSRNIHYVSKMILWDISRYFGKLWLK